MSVWLDKYRECEVEVIYLTDNSSFRDRGRLSDFGDGWIELDKPGGETFLVPVTAIRLIKVISPPVSTENRLLRPVETRIEEPIVSTDQAPQIKQNRQE